MSSKSLKLPERNVRDVAHELSFKLARERLSALSDVPAQRAKCGARFVAEKNAVVIEHLNRAYEISVTEGEIKYTDSSDSVPLRDKILILHYFLSSSGAPLTGKMITYKELHDGINYYPTFSKRAIEPVVTRFKTEPEKLLEVGKKLGGIKAAFGDSAVTIPAFPRVPLTYVLWVGDKEFGPDGNILFDNTISEYLPIEDITILCELIAWRLVRL
jgi:hypothetical protein